MSETEKLEDNECAYYLAVYAVFLQGPPASLSGMYECMVCGCGEQTGKGKCILPLDSCRTPGKQLRFRLVTSKMGMVREHTGRAQKSQPSV